MDVTSAETPTPTELFARLGRSLLGTAARFVRRTEDAEDIVQEAFLAYHRRPSGLPLDEAAAWMHRVVVNRALDTLRRRARWRLEEIPEDGAFAPPAFARLSVAPDPSLRVDLERAVGELPEAARLVFLLHDVEGLKHQEIAERLGLSVGTSKSQLHRARRRLRAWLSSPLPVEEVP